MNLGCELNLQNINFRTRNSEYNPARFHGVVMRIREPRCTALIFKSGKLVCTGARNEEFANLGTRKFARIIQKLGYVVREFHSNISYNSMGIFSDQIQGIQNTKSCCNCRSSISNSIGKFKSNAWTI